MEKAARICSLFIAVAFAGSLLCLAMDFDQWLPLDIATLIISAVFGVGLLARDQNAGWYYLIVAAALLAGLLTYERQAFWVVLDFIVVGVNLALSLGAIPMHSKARRKVTPAIREVMDEDRRTTREEATGEAPTLPNNTPLDIALVNSLLKVNEFGVAIRQSYSKMVDHTVQGFRSLAQEADDIKLKESNLDFEVAALLYFTFDLAMSSGTEKDLRSAIREAFVAIERPPAREASIMADRAEEYAAALRVADASKGLLRLGNEFARHLGQAGDLMVVAQASAVFSSTYRAVADQVNAAIRKIANAAGSWTTTG